MNSRNQSSSRSHTFCAGMSRSVLVSSCVRRPICFAPPTLLYRAVVLSPRRAKGDYGFNVFHNSNPQHGGSYARHERRMRDDEVEDFLRSVKGWSPVDDVMSGDATRADEAPSAMTVFTGEEAIMRVFTFPTFGDAYLFMGRLWAFCYGSDKHPHVTWHGCCVTVYLYSPSFRGLSKREARLAAFLNDQYNMFKKSKRQQQRLLDSVVRHAVVERQVGESVAEALRRREAERHRPLTESLHGPERWDTLLRETREEGNQKHERSMDFERE